MKNSWNIYDCRSMPQMKGIETTAIGICQQMAFIKKAAEANDNLQDDETLKFIDTTMRLNQRFMWLLFANCYLYSFRQLSM